MRRATRGSLSLLLVLAIAGCARGGSGAVLASASPVPAPEAIVNGEYLADAGVQVGGNVSALQPAIVAAETAEQTALTYAFDQTHAGQVIAVGRDLGRRDDDPSTPTRTVWVVVLGAGGTVPVMGPNGGTPSPIDYQILLVDDQTGALLRGPHIVSGVLPS